MQKAINFNDVATASIKGSDYRIHFWYMSNDDAINIMKNSSETTCYQRNGEIMLNRAK